MYLNMKYGVVEIQIVFGECYSRSPDQVFAPFFVIIVVDSKT